MSPASPAPAVVRELPPGASLRPFIEAQYRLNRGDANWVAPLRMAVRTVLDRAKHPFHRHADTAYFLAEREGRAVGRVAAVVNHRHNEFHDERTGFFGLWECEDDAGTARALLDAAEAWLRERGMERVLGPVNLSTNEELSSPGVLVDGFESRPMIQMSHNAPYHAALIEGAGYGKAQDLLAYWVDDVNPPERLVRAFDRVLERENATIRSLDLRRFRDEVQLVKDIYNSAWARNWGFVPMTDAEFDHMAKEFRPVIDADLCMIVEVEGEPVGFSLALPDYNHALRHLRDGRLFPLGLPRLLWHRRSIRGIRVITLGFRPGFQHHGLGAALYLRTWQVGVAKGYDHAEASWILEDNHDMRRALERMGAREYRRYRVYGKEMGKRKE